MSDTSDPTPVTDPMAQPYVAPTVDRRPRRIAVAGLAVLALAAGAFGVSVLAAGDGADSPEDAVEAMFDAIDHEDPIGVLEALDPTERDILRPALEETGEQAKRVEVASDDLDLHKVSGLDLTVEDLRMTTTELGAGFVAVDLTGGTVSSASDLERLPFGATITDVLDADERQEGRDLDRTDEGRIELAGLRLVATKSGDGWHVSVLYSIAEQVRRDADPTPAVPRFGKGIAAKGVASPEAAVREGLDAALHLDVRRLIELSPPGEMDVLHDYGPALVAAAEEAADDDDFDAPTVSDLELETTDGPDGTKVVTASTYRVDLGDGDTWSYDGRCTTTTYTYESYGYDDVPSTETETQEVCEGDVGAEALPLGLVGFASPGGDVRVVTEQHDGQWYVSPTRTIIESTVGTLRSLSSDKVRRTVRWWSGDYWIGEPAAFWKACGVGEPAADVSDEAGQKAHDSCLRQLPEDYEGTPFGGTFSGEGSSVDEGWTNYDPDGGTIEEPPPMEVDPVDACYDQDDDAAVGTCLQDLVDRGEIEASELEGFRCEAAYDAVADDATDDEIDAADQAYETCMEAVHDLPTTTAPG
ncbi:hypothetical protein BH10ACT1_BH10ACT1_20760 [soil metagenome]